MTKKTVTFSLPQMKSINPKARIALAVVAAILVLSGTYSAAHDSGYKQGYDAGEKAGIQTGDKQGYARGMERVKTEYDNGYWDGRVDGCEWLVNSLGKGYVIGVSNPFTTWYYLMGIGSEYASTRTCEVTGSGGYNVPTINTLSGSN